MKLVLHCYSGWGCKDGTGSTLLLQSEHRTMELVLHWYSEWECKEEVGNFKMQGSLSQNTNEITLGEGFTRNDGRSYKFHENINFRQEGLTLPARLVSTCCKQVRQLGSPFFPDILPQIIFFIVTPRFHQFTIQKCFLNYMKL